jgi:speckle-type POZ protein
MKSPAGVFKTEDSTSACWGYSRFMRKTELQESSYILNDTLVVECNLSVIKFMPAHEDSDVKLTIPSKVPPSELVANLSRLLEATEGADVSFKVKDARFSRLTRSSSPCGRPSFGWSSTGPRGTREVVA